MTTTNDCKIFLAEFVKHNPSIVESIYGSGCVIPTLLDDACNPKKWKRRYKCNPGGGLYEHEEYDIFDKNIKISRMGYGKMKTMPITEFVSERGFYLDPDTYDTGVSFVVLEDHHGKLHLGNYIGD